MPSVHGQGTAGNLKEVHWSHFRGKGQVLSPQEGSPDADSSSDGTEMAEPPLHEYLGFRPSDEQAMSTTASPADAMSLVRLQVKTENLRWAHGAAGDSLGADHPVVQMLGVELRDSLALMVRQQSSLQPPAKLLAAKKALDGWRIQRDGLAVRHDRLRSEQRVLSSKIAEVRRRHQDAQAEVAKYEEFLNTTPAAAPTAVAV